MDTSHRAVGGWLAALALAAFAAHGSARPVHAYSCELALKGTITWEVEIGFYCYGNPQNCCRVY